MRNVLAVASALGVAGVIASFGLFYLGERVFHLNRDVLQTLIYLKLSIAGHLTIFVARTHGRFWSYRPSWLLVGAVLGTQLLATAIAVSGFLMQPLEWQLAAFAWGYALVCFVLLDQVKVITYQVLERRGIAAGELSEA